MAGFAYGFDEGGAIPDDASQNDQRTAGQNLLRSELDYDNNVDLGAAQQAQGAQALDISESVPRTAPPSGEGVQQPGAIPDEPGQQPSQPGNAKRIIQYLTGAGAAHPDVTDKYATAVKLEHPGTSDDDANLISIMKARQHGGDEAASALLQSHMQQYLAKNSFAYSALTGGRGANTGGGDGGNE